MKKSFFLFFFILTLSLSSQIRLTDVNFEFKKNNDYHQLTTNVNPITSEIFTFASDKESIFGARFNSSVFFSDSLTIKKPNEYNFSLGTSFLENNNPISYWVTKNYEEIIGIEFDFENRETKTIELNLNLKEVFIFSEFSEKGTYYFLIEDKELKEIQLISLKGKTIQKNTLDFSKCNFEDDKQNKTTISDLLKEYGVTKIEKKGFNSFEAGTSKLKYYLHNDMVIFTLDHVTTKTQVLELNLSTFEVNESIFLQNTIEKNIKQSNSLLVNNYLFQLKSNKDIFEIQILDYTNKNLINTYTIDKINPSPFKNSAFYSQTSNSSPRKLKNTKKFINKTSNTKIGALIYNYNGNYFATFGGSKEIRRNSDLILGVGLAMTSVAAGYNGFDYDTFSGDLVIQNTTFEVVLNSSFEETKNNEPLFIDKINQFTSNNRNIRYEHYFPFEDYYILCHYDKKNKAIVLTKFQDGIQ